MTDGMTFRTFPTAFKVRQQRCDLHRSPGHRGFGRSHRHPAAAFDRRTKLHDRQDQARGAPLDQHDDLKLAPSRRRSSATPKTFGLLGPASPQTPGRSLFPACSTRFVLNPWA